MEHELLDLAAAPTTRALVGTLSERLGPNDAPALSEEALARGEIRAALNLALAGALGGAPPPADLAARLVPTIESTDLVLALLSTVRTGLADALIASAGGPGLTPTRLGLILFLAASRLEAPPDELRRRIRLAARAGLHARAEVLVGLAALEVGDPDVLEVAHSCVEMADGPDGRRIAWELLEKLETPLEEALPEEASPELFGGFTIRRNMPRTGRNDPCPCGSGKKHKRCCLAAGTGGGPAADTARPWGDRAQFHRTMSDAQFEGLHPLEVARIRPGELTTTRLVRAAGLLAEHRLFEEAEQFLGELSGRRDLPEGTTADTVRVEVVRAAIAVRDLDRAERVLASFESPDAVPEHVRVAHAIASRSPEALDRLEALADRALREPSEEALGLLGGVLIYFCPAMGILLARGTVDPARPLEVESMLGMVEEARDILLLPPHDPAWEVFDLLSERHVEARLEISAMEENEQLAAEAEELRRSVAMARAVEQSTRRELERRERELERAVRAAEDRREEADRARTDGPTPEELARLRRKIEEYKVRIAEGNHERRALRRRLSRIGSRIDAAVAVDDAQVPGEDADELEYEEECGPERRVPRIPHFTREFREGLRGVADHVARAALATAGALAATDPGAWSSVKRIKALPDVLSCRIGRHRALFRLVGEDEIELCRLIHRRDLEGTLKKMG